MKSHLQKDEWLTEMIETTSWKVDLGNADELIPNIAQWEEPAFFFSKVATDRQNLVNKAILKGFSLVTTEITFACSLDRLKGPVDYVRPAEPGDKEATGKIARKAFSHDRFHQDPMLRRHADAIKQGWVDNYFGGTRGDAMLIYEKDDSIHGFLQILRRNEDVIIDLIAVDESMRHCGVASSLINGLGNIFPGSKRVVVGTQLTNVASMRLYSGRGFTPFKSNYVLHAHSTKPNDV